MSLKSIESVVRELQQTVVTLVNKVDSLECKISEQSAIIIKLSATKDNTLTASTRKSLVASAPPPPSQTSSAAASTTTAAQRPIRTARVQASAAIAELSNAPSVRRNGRAVRAITPKSDGAAPIISTDKLIIGKESSHRVMDASDVVRPEITVATAGPLTTTSDESGSQWQVVNNRRRRKQQAPIVVGTAINNNDLQAAERVRHIQAWCFKPETTTGTVLGFLNKIIKSEFTVEKRDIKSERHASFLIGMPEKVYDAVTSPAAWPVGVRFTEWFQFRPRGQQRGSERTARAPAARACPGSGA